jgi:hypothetical protein
MRLVDDLSRWRTEFDSWILQVRFVLGKGTGNGSSAQASYFSCQYYSPLLHTHDLIATIIGTTSERRQETFNQNNALTEIEGVAESTFLFIFFHVRILCRQLEVGMHPETPATGQLD